MNLAYVQGGLKLEINIPPQHISAKSKGGLIIEGGVSLSEYGTNNTTACHPSAADEAYNWPINVSCAVGDYTQHLGFF